MRGPTDEEESRARTRGPVSRAPCVRSERKTFRSIPRYPYVVETRSRVNLGSLEHDGEEKRRGRGSNATARRLRWRRTGGRRFVPFLCLRTELLARFIAPPFLSNVKREEERQTAIERLDRSRGMEEQSKVLGHSGFRLRNKSLKFFLSSAYAKALLFRIETRGKETNATNSYTPLTL